MATVDPHIYLPKKEPGSPASSKSANDGHPSHILDYAIHVKCEEIIDLLTCITKMESFTNPKDSLSKLENLLNRMMEDLCGAISKVDLGHFFYDEALLDQFALCCLLN